MVMPSRRAWGWSLALTILLGFWTVAVVVLPEALVWLIGDSLVIEGLSMPRVIWPLAPLLALLLAGLPALLLGLLSPVRFARTAGRQWLLTCGFGAALGCVRLIPPTYHEVYLAALAAVAAIAAAVLILALGWTVADPVASIVISLLILYGAWRLLREATNVLMQGVPPGIDVAALEKLARDTPGVREVHDLHVWSLVGDVPVITAHVVLHPSAHGVEVARDVGRRLEHGAPGSHVTVQPEASAGNGDLLGPETLVRR